MAKKVTVVGAGFYGSTTALRLAEYNIFDEVVLTDIVVAAIGQAHFLKAEMIKPGAAILDVGISRTDAGLLGDADPSVMNVASFVAPMPGGVGPMTRAMLLMNVVDACER